MPDLFAGRPVVLTGRFKGEGDEKVKVSGRIGGKPFERVLSINVDEPGLRHKALPALWARQKIQSINQEMAYIGNGEGGPRRIRELALSYSLMSAYTSFVAVDSLSRTRGDHGTTVVQPVPVPEGVRYDTTVGSQGQP